MANPANSGQADRCMGGFTLLEVLIAMALLSVIVTVGFSVMRVGFNSWEAGEVRFEQAERQAIGIGFLRNYLANALPVMDELSGREPVFSFSGTAEVLRFIAYPPKQVGRGMRYRFQVGAGDGALMLAFEPFGRHLLTVLSEPERMVLQKGVRGLRFAYFGRRPDQALPEWLDTWTYPYLPTLIRVNVLTDAGPWELVVAPRLGVS